MMTKQELRQLAAVGAQKQLAKIERDIDALQREFPDIFINNERVVLLKAEIRDAENGNGFHTKRRSAIAASWTQERRDAQAERMRARATQKTVQKTPRAKRKKTTSKKATTRWSDWKGKWYERLLMHGPERVGDSAKALGVKNSATLLTGAVTYLKSGVIVKESKGVYRAGQSPTA